MSLPRWAGQFRREAQASGDSIHTHHRRGWQEGQVTFLSQQGQETLLLTASDPKTVGFVLGGLEDPREGGVEAQE